MKARLKFLIYGILIGVFISGLTIVLIKKDLIHFQSTAFYESSELSIPPADNSACCQISSSKVVSTSLLLDINLSSLEDLKSLPAIGGAKAKSIIDFRKIYGNFISVDELLFVPGIVDSLFQQICHLVVLNTKDNG